MPWMRILQLNISDNVGDSMNIEKYKKKIAKLQYLADSNHAKSKLLKEKGKFVNAGKLEGVAHKYEMEIKSIELRLMDYAEELELKARRFREKGRLRKAQVLEHKAETILDTASETQPKTEPRPTEYREKEIITREIVRIPCKYCGTLNNQTDTKCKSCGASLS